MLPQSGNAMAALAACPEETEHEEAERHCLSTAPHDLERTGPFDRDPCPVTRRRLERTGHQRRSHPSQKSPQDLDYVPVAGCEGELALSRASSPDL